MSVVVLHEGIDVTSEMVRHASLQADAWLTALDSMCSDLFRLDPGMLSDKM